MAVENEDDRLKRELGMDDMRVDRSAQKVDQRGAEERAMIDREVEANRELTEDDRLQMFREELFNDALPNLPAIDGYHVCWLTTTNQNDPIQRRIRLGYEPIKPEDAPGLEYMTVKSGEFAGFISINEMLAFKLPQSLYLKYMQEVHHAAPAREQEKLADTMAQIKQQAEAKGADVIEFEGNAELREAQPRQGVFA